MSDEQKGRPTAPRGWRPGLLYIVAAAFAIVLILVWLFSRGPEPAPVPAAPPQAPPTGTGR